PSWHGLLLFVWVQPDPESQPSSVQTLLSLQLGGGPPVQLPPLHVSAVVQASPSSHGLLLLVWGHPDPGLQPSLVQTVLSLQLRGGPPTQLPPLHVSLVVQALPSAHGSLLLVWAHPDVGVPLSSV